MTPSLVVAFSGTTMSTGVGVTTSPRWSPLASYQTGTAPTTSLGCSTGADRRSSSRPVTASTDPATTAAVAAATMTRRRRPRRVARRSSSPKSGGTARLARVSTTSRRGVNSDMGSLLDEQRGEGGPTTGQPCLDRPGRHAEGVGHLLHRQVGQGVQRDPLALCRRQLAERLKQDDVAIGVTVARLLDEPWSETDQTLRPPPPTAGE